MEFSKTLGRFDDEIFASINERKLELEKEGRTFYNLSIGTPDFKPSKEIMEAASKACLDPENWKYALRDLPELRQSVCSYYKRRFNAEIEPDMINSCQGTQEGMGHLAMALCDEGDTVILPSPCYPNFISAAKLVGADVYYYPMTEENGFLPELDKIPEDVARKAKYIVVSLPSNPTGSIATPKLYRDLIEFARKYDVLVVHDNPYSDIIFDGAVGGSFLAYEGALDVGVEFFSLSKSFDVTGARISFLIGRRDVVNAFAKLRSQIDFGMFLPVQKAAIAALNSDLDPVKKQCLEYEARRDALCESFTEIGWEIPKNHGSMFVWAKIPGGKTDSMAFCRELMEKSGVIVTPGISFGDLGEGYVRFALVLPPEKLKEAAYAVRDSGILD